MCVGQINEMVRVGVGSGVRTKTRREGREGEWKVIKEGVISSQKDKRPTHRENQEWLKIRKAYEEMQKKDMRGGERCFSSLPGRHFPVYL